jgi:hypothetical protein
MTMTNTILNGSCGDRTAPVTSSPGSKGRVQRRWRLPKADRVLYWSAAMAPWGLAILLLAVSMPHLANGFMTICRCGPLAGWLLAVAIDTAQVVAKLQLTVAKQHAITTAAKWTSTGIVAATALMSMALNVLAFLAGATTRTGTVLAVVTGILLPLLVLALSYTGSAFALAKRRRTPKAKGRGTK